VHVAIVAKDRATVDAFHKAAMAAGGRDNGAPGIRAHYHPELLRRVRARSRRPQYRSRLPRAGLASRFHFWIARELRAGVAVIVPGVETSGDAMPIDPPEIPPATPGQPTEPPPENPPGNPRPEVPPPFREPGQPPQPQELSGKMPDELPIRGPNSPRTPNPATDRVPDEHPPERAMNNDACNPLCR
jgi:outer membrane biosynthesis protein TonB